LLNLQRAIKAIQNDLKDLKLFTEYNLNDKIKNLTGLLNDAELFNKDLNDLRMKLDVLDGIIGDLDNEDINDLRNVTEEQLTIYEGIVDQIARKDFNATLDKYKSLLQEFENANKTVGDLKASFADHSSEIEAIKNKNAYIQKGLAEVKSYIEKAKSLEKFRDKDVEFKAYFDNLEQIRNETGHLQKNSATTLNQIENMIKEGQESLSSSNKDLSDLNSKVEDLQELYSDHETKYQVKYQELELVINWIPKLWQHVNKYIEMYNSIDLVLGPKIFTSFPMDTETIPTWFIEIWNNTFVPFLIDTIKEGLQAHGTFLNETPWENPKMWLTKTLPCIFYDTGVLDSLYSIEAYHVGFQRDVDENKIEEGEQKRMQKNDFNKETKNENFHQNHHLDLETFSYPNTPAKTSLNRNSNENDKLLSMLMKLQETTLSNTKLSNNLSILNNCSNNCFNSINLNNDISKNNMNLIKIQKSVESTF
jgi:hypothetical protein